MPQLNDELRYKLLKALEANPNASQRELAAAFDISLGRINYCLKALAEVGLIKAKNFKNSQNRLAYSYLLTPKGVEEKALITKAFLTRKLKEADELEREIEEIRADLAQQ